MDSIGALLVDWSDLILAGLLACGGLIALALVTARLGAIRSRQIARVDQTTAGTIGRKARELRTDLLGLERDMAAKYPSLPPGQIQAIESDLEADLEASAKLWLRKRVRHIRRLFLILNIVTTLLVAFPFITAIWSLLQRHPATAFTWDIAGLAALILAKGGLFFLTYLLAPAIKGAAAAAGGIVAHEVWKKWKARHGAASADDPDISWITELFDFPPT